MVSHCACSTMVFRDRALHEHSRPSSLSSHTSSKLACFSSCGMAPVLVPLRPSNEIRYPSELARSLQGWGLIDLPLRASNEGLRRPRVARAQKIISLHPVLCSYPSL
jgi:hypothetical protein